MADVLVSPTDLKTLADNQDAAAKDAQAAADALSGTGSDCWISHGVISGSSNGAFSTIEDIRQAAGSALADGSKGLAAKLRAAKLAYEGVDRELAGNLNKQMLDK
jgi:Excreted virulence factor EspC, type VII ESX diderm